MAQPYFQRFFKDFSTGFKFGKKYEASEKTREKKAIKNRGKLVWNPHKQGTFKNQQR